MGSDWKLRGGQDLAQETKEGFPGRVVLQNVDLFTLPPPVDIATLTKTVNEWYARQGILQDKQKGGQCTDRASHLGRVLNARGLRCLKVWLYPEKWIDDSTAWEFHVFLAARDTSGKWYGIDPWWSKPGVLPMAEMLKVHATEGVVGLDLSSLEQPFPLAMASPVNGNPKVGAGILQEFIRHGYELLQDDAWAD